MTSSQYDDVKVRIFECRGDDYPVEITLNDEREFRGVLPSHILPWTSAGDPIADGQRLFDDLCTDVALRSAWAEARGQAPKRRIRLLIDAPELNIIPWELLHEDETTMLSANANTPFSRYLPVAKAWGKAVREKPLRVLAVISNPEDLEDYNLASLDVATEQSVLKTAFSALNADDIALDFLQAPVTLKGIESALNKGYHILHYVGHGVFNKRKQQAALYLQDDFGDTQVVRGDKLVNMLARQGAQPRLVFLAACQSATRSTANAFRGLGPSLVGAGVPAIVAMQDFVSIQTAQALSQAFYQNLTRHGVVDQAMNEARSTLLTADRPDAAVPVLFMRLKSGQLWSEEPEVSVPQPEKKRPDLAELYWFFAEIEKDIARDIPSEQQTDALARLNELKTAITDQVPDCAAIESIYQWFSQNGLRLAGKVLNYVILHPTTRELMAFAGDAYAQEHQQRFIT